MHENKSMLVCTIAHIKSFHISRRPAVLLTSNPSHLPRGPQRLHSTRVLLTLRSKQRVIHGVNQIPSLDLRVCGKVESSDLPTPAVAYSPQLAEINGVEEWAAGVSLQRLKVFHDVLKVANLGAREEAIGRWGIIAILTSATFAIAAYIAWDW